MPVNDIIHDIGGALYNVQHPTYVALKVGSDWTPAIQAALADAAVAGGVVYLPPGTYATTVPLTSLPTCGSKAPGGAR